MAGVLIRYLLGLGYPHVITDECGPGRVLYRIRVRRDPLRALAARVGRALP